MTLWRLEWLRLVRTRRLLVLVGVYLFFGLLGPITARYLPEILGRFGGGIEVTLPPTAPVDGMAQFTSNANQLGLLAVLVVAAGALAFDARPEMAAFLRTRTSGAAALLWPRYVVTTAAAWAAFALGTVGAWYETVVLLGSLPVTGVLAGVAYTWLYLAFAVAVAALASALVRSVATAVAVTVGVLVALPVAALVPALQPWLPSALLGALVELADGGAATGPLRAAAVTVVATAALLAASVRLLERREL